MAVLIEELIKSIEQWLSIANKQRQPRVDPDLDPVLLVPGIAGSVLNAVDEQGREERVWVRIFGADHEFRDKLWSRFDPATGKTVSMDEKTRIVVPEDRYGLSAIDTLDPDLIIGQEGVFYYHDLIIQMIRWGFQEGKTLFGFGFDFRQSNRLQETLDKFHAKLESVYTSSGGRQMTIITHSMGGLLVKCFMHLHSDIFEKYVKNWIAIAAPFQDLLLTATELSRRQTPPAPPWFELDARPTVPDHHYGLTEILRVGAHTQQGQVFPPGEMMRSLRGTWIYNSGSLKWMLFC